MRRIAYFAIFWGTASHSTLFAATWNLNANGNWNDDGNWTSPSIFPNGVDAIAIFGNVITANRNVTLGQDITIGTINFDDNNRYTITAAAANALTFDVSSGNAMINITNANGDGPHRILNDMIFNDTVLIDHNSTATFTLSGMISGDGGLTKTGPGTTELDNSGNNYAGITTVNEGILDYITAGSILGGNSVIINGGSLTIDQSMGGSNALNVTINSLGTLNQGNNDTVRLISLQGAGAVVLTTSTGGGSLLEFQGTGASTIFSGAISGGATSGSSSPNAGNRIRKLGSSTLTLTGSSSYVSRTFLNEGVINVQNDSALGASGANSGVFVEMTDAALEAQNSISLNKAFNLNGSGIGGNGALRSVSGNNTLSDTVQIGWSGGPVSQDDATIGVDADMLTLSGTIQGARSLTKVGNGTLLVSGTGNLTSSTAVDQGKFLVDGSYTSTGGLSVASGATLGGSGTVTSDASISGTLAPGNSIGTITLVGTETLQSGSILEIETSPTLADQVNITGSLTIQPGSTLKVIPEAGVYSKQTSYLIVHTTTGVTNTFSAFNVTLPTFSATAQYTADDIFLVLSTVPFSNLIQGGNAGAIAKCLSTANPPAGSDLSLIIAQLQFLSLDEIRSALNQMQPSALTSLALAQEYSTLYMNSAIFNRLNQLILSRSFRLPSKRLSFWCVPLGAISWQQERREEPGYRSWTSGFTAGLDYAWEKGIVAGTSAGYSYIDLSWNERRGRSVMQNGYGSIYGGFQNDFVYLFTSIIGGYNHYQVSRHIIFPQDSIINVNRRAKSNHNGIQGSGHLKTGLFFPYNHFKLCPFLAADYIYLHEQSFREHGAKSLDLDVSKKNSNFLDLEAGFQLSGYFYARRNKFSPTIAVSIIREERFQGKRYHANLKDSSCTFTVNGLNPNRTLLGAKAGFTMHLPNENCTLSFDYQGRYGNNFQDSVVEATFLFRF